MQLLTNFLNKTFGVYKIKGIEIEPTYWEAGAIIILLFLLVLTLARLRYLYVEWHFSKQNISFLFYGFLLAIIIEGFLLIGGRTFLIVTLGWKSAPKPISTALETGREKLINVLGEETSVSPTLNSVLEEYSGLSPADSQSFREDICRTSE